RTASGRGRREDSWSSRDRAPGRAGGRKGSRPAGAGPPAGRRVRGAAASARPDGAPRGRTPGPRASRSPAARELPRGGRPARGRDQPERRQAAEPREDHQADAARAQSEERNADDRVGEVVVELVREDAGVADLEEEDAEGEKEYLRDERALPRRCSQRRRPGGHPMVR